MCVSVVLESVPTSTSFYLSSISAPLQALTAGRCSELVALSWAGWAFRLQAKSFTVLCQKGKGLLIP